jgi:hypothetical protein
MLGITFNTRNTPLYFMDGCGNPLPIQYNLQVDDVKLYLPTQMKTGGAKREKQTACALATSRIGMLASASRLI